MGAVVLRDSSVVQCGVQLEVQGRRGLVFGWAWCLDGASATGTVGVESLLLFCLRAMQFCSAILHLCVSKPSGC